MHDASKVWLLFIDEYGEACTDEYGEAYAENYGEANKGFANHSVSRVLITLLSCKYTAISLSGKFMRYQRFYFVKLQYSFDCFDSFLIIPVVLFYSKIHHRKHNAGSTLLLDEWSIQR